MITFDNLFTLGAAIDHATGKVDADAYAGMVAQADKLLADLRRAADEARA